MIRRGSAILLACATLAGGCVSRRLEPVVPMPVRLVAAEPFVIHVPRRAVRCAHLEVRATVDDIRGDTMFLASVESLRRPRGEYDCVTGGPGLVVLSSAPSLRSQVVTGNITDSSLLMVLFVPLAAFVSFLLLIG